MTCPPDAFRSGTDLVVLQPGGNWAGTVGNHRTLSGALLMRCRTTSTSGAVKGMEK